MFFSFPSHQAPIFEENQSQNSQTPLFPRVIRSSSTNDTGLICQIGGDNLANKNEINCLGERNDQFGSDKLNSGGNESYDADSYDTDTNQYNFHKQEGQQYSAEKASQKFEDNIILIDSLSALKQMGSQQSITNDEETKIDNAFDPSDKSDCSVTLSDLINRNGKPESDNEKEMVEFKQLFNDSLIISKQNTELKTNRNLDFPKIASSQTSSKNSINKIIPQIKRPYFKFDDKGEECKPKINIQANAFAQDSIDSVWENHHCSIALKRNKKMEDKLLLSEHWDCKGVSELELMYGQHKKQRDSSQKEVSRFEKVASRQKSHFMEEPQFYVPFERIIFKLERFESVKNYEFNCFEDTDLKISDEFKNCLINTSLDNDTDTDEETKDINAQQCFADLIEAIEIQNQEEKKINPLLKVPEDSKDLWKYFNLPIHFAHNQE